VVAPQDLQDKSKRSYFAAANALLPGELYISRIDLNEERGQIEMPPRTIVRIATPVADSNRKRRGIVIINIEMKYLFNLVRAPGESRLGVGRELAAVRKDGTAIPVEIGLTPYADKGRQSILVSIIDLSRRKA
jgi:hypothetical protein